MTSPVQPKERGPVIWYVVLALVVVVGIVAVVATRSSNKDANTKTEANQVAPVTVGATGSSSSAEALSEFDSAGSDSAIGKVIPTVSGKDLDGKPLTIGPDGKAKIIIFAAHWCPHCQREIPLLADHLKDKPMPSDVELLTVSTSVAPERGNYPPKAWLQEAGWTAPVLADSSKNVAAATYGLSSFPYFVVADADGKVVFRISGEISTDDFDRLVEAAQTGKSPV